MVSYTYRIIGVENSEHTITIENLDSLDTPQLMRSAQGCAARCNCESIYSIETIGWKAI